MRASTELTRNVTIDRIVCHLGRVLDREVCRRRLPEIGSRQIARVHGADEPTRRVVRVPAVQDSLANHVVLLQLGGEMRALVDDLVARRCNRVAYGACNAAGRIVFVVRRVDRATLIRILIPATALVAVRRYSRTNLRNFR